MPTFANPAFEALWNRTDKPVAELAVSRTWMWGPDAIDSREEPYRESPGGKRLVMYFDKSRMEITNPSGDRNSQWFVTNGLLAVELITGQMQVGDNTFQGGLPAEIPIAGDPDDPNGPHYASFIKHLPPAGERKAAVIETISRTGVIGQNGALGNYTDYVYFVPETGHNVPRVFWDFLNSTGRVWDGSKLVDAKLFDPTFFATGLPITEAFWAEVKVKNVVQPVLTQAYERRVLTFTPQNPQGWQVEMGNIGRHYFTWRYQTRPLGDTFELLAVPG